MAIENYNFIKYSPELEEHLNRHLSGSQTAGSHFSREAFDSAKSLIDFAYEHVKDYDGKRVVREIDMGRDIGYDSLVQLSELPPEAQVTLEPRGRDGYLANIVRGVSKPTTRNMVIVAGPLREEGTHGFYTIFPGQNALPFPATREKLVEMGYSGDSLEDQVKINEGYENFWKNHGFIVD